MNPQIPVRTSWTLGKIVYFALLSAILIVGVAACMVPAGIDSPSVGERSNELPTSQPNAAEEDVKPYTPNRQDFKLKVRVLEKQCFGSAGCNITYRIKPTYTGDDYGDRSFEVTYEVRGVEDGPQINTFEIVGDEVSVQSEEFAQTLTAGTKLKAKVTEVSES